MSNWSRKMRERHNSGRRDNSLRKSAPLRKIIEVLLVGDSDIFGSGSKVRLECGHTVYTHSNNKARCVNCLKELNQLNNSPYA